MAKVIDLYRDFVDLLQTKNLTVKDIEWFGNETNVVSKLDLHTFIVEFKINPIIGKVIVPPNFVIVGKGWFVKWVDEKWAFESFPIKPITQPQHIVAMPSSLLEHRVKGWCDYTIKGTDLVIACREHLETNPAYRQVLPITAFVKNVGGNNSDAEWAVFCYLRGNGGGEARLHGKVATAVGGHWDLADIIFDNKSVIHYDASIVKGVEREMEEEVLVTSNYKQVVTYPKLLCADDVAVDRVHVAQITFVILDADATIETREPDQLTPLGFFTSQEVYQQFNQTETWTDYIFDVVDSTDFLLTVL